MSDTAKPHPLAGFDVETQYALSLIERGVVQGGNDDTFDRHGRRGSRYLEPSEIVQRAFEIATLAIAEARRRVAPEAAEPKMARFIKEGEALISEREGMIAENRQREHLGQAMAFTETDFAANAEEIRLLKQKEGER